MMFMKARISRIIVNIEGSIVSHMDLTFENAASMKEIKYCVWEYFPDWSLMYAYEMEDSDA